MRAAVDRVQTDGPLGALVNNAGYSRAARGRPSTSSASACSSRHVFGLLRLSQLVLPGMRAQSAGRIVNLSSMGGKLTFPGGGVYHATKYAVEALSDVLRFEVQGFGVDVVIVEPGLPDGLRRHAVSTVKPARARTRPSTWPSAGPRRARTRAGCRGSARVPERWPRSSSAVTAKRPRTRYKVTASARVLMVQRRLVPDRVWDRMMSTTFPIPRP